MYMFLSVHTLNQQHSHFLGIPFERETERVSVRDRGERKSKGHGICCFHDKTPLWKIITHTETDRCG